MHRLGILTALAILGTEGIAGAEPLQVHLTDFVREFRWEEHYESEDEGGPVVTSYRLPEDVSSVHSLLILVGGEVREGRYRAFCEPDPCEAIFWTTPFHANGPCINVELSQEEPGPFALALEVTGCDFGSLIDTALEVEAYTEPVQSDPAGVWDPDPRVAVDYFILVFDVDRVVPTAPSSWSAVKAVYDVD